MFRSLRYRLQAWHTVILLLVVAGFGGTLYVEASRRRFDEIDGELLAAARVLEGVLEPNCRVSRRQARLDSAAAHRQTARRHRTRARGLPESD